MVLTNQHSIREVILFPQLRTRTIKSEDEKESIEQKCPNCNIALAKDDAGIYFCEKCNYEKRINNNNG
jgi:hypothetical protein